MHTPNPPDEIPWADHVPDASVDQAAFNAAWDLRTLWQRGQRIRPAEYRDRLGAAVFAWPEVLYALASAEQRACLEAGEPPSTADDGWLREALPGRSGIYSRLLESLASDPADRADAPTEPTRPYPYLSPSAVPGELGRLGHFRVIREIGRGGMGVVFKAEDEKTILGDKRRALKVLEPRTRTPESLARFVREVQTVHQIPHLNVVGVYTAAEENGVAYLEMEYVYGPTLDDLIGHHLGSPVPLSLAADLIRQTALGLAAAHNHGFTHRDVKPANILLEWVLEDDAYPLGWRARVCDFGLAVAADQAKLTREGGVPGTLLYLSSEQLDPQLGGVGPLSDVFALGIVAFELVTGHHPFKCDDPRATALKLLAGNVESPRSENGQIPERLERLILQMLKRLPNERPRAEDVAAELSNILSLNEVPPTIRSESASGLLERARVADVQNPPTAGSAKEKHRRPAGDEAQDVLLRTTKKSPAVAPLTLDLAVTVWKKETRDPSPSKEASVPGLSVDDPKAVPLQAGDYVRLEVRLHRPAYIYVLQLEASGDVAPLYPWLKCDWGQRGAEQPSVRLDLPSDPLKKSIPLTDGPSGIEAFVVLVREGPLGEDENGRLKELFRSGLRQGKFDPLRGAVWVGTDEERFGHEADRARVNLDAARPVEDPVMRVRRLLQSDEIRGLSKVCRGVCYPFAGT